MKNNIVCIKWGKKFDSSYVNKLYRAVNRNCSNFDRFICLTEDPERIDPNVEVFNIPRIDLEICWNKITLFEKTLHDIEGQILFFDLDVVIKDNINEFFDFSPESKFVSISEWNMDYVDYGMMLNENIKPFNGSAMRFNVGSLSFVAEDFYEKRNSLMEEKFYDSALGYNGKVTYHDLMNLPPVVFNSDQEWMYFSLIQNNIKIDYFPEGWLASYKFSSTNNAKIIVFHGLPKPDEVNDDFVKEHWK